MPHRFCHSCRAPLHGADKHGEWVSCLGAPPRLKQHSLGRNATTAVTGVSPLCSSGYLSFQRATPSLVPSHLFPPRDLRGKSSGAEDLSTRKWVSLHRLYPRITHSLPTESFYLFSSRARTSIHLQLRGIWSHSVELSRLFTAAPWPIPLRQTKVNGIIWHPQPELWVLHLWPLNGSLRTFPRVC